jgi:hypothetical protein
MKENLHLAFLALGVICERCPPPAGLLAAASAGLTRAVADGDIGTSPLCACARARGCVPLIAAPPTRADVVTEVFHTAQFPLTDENVLGVCSMVMTAFLSRGGSGP